MHQGCDAPGACSVCILLDSENSSHKTARDGREEELLQLAVMQNLGTRMAVPKTFLKCLLEDPSNLEIIYFTCVPK